MKLARRFKDPHAAAVNRKISHTAALQNTVSVPWIPAALLLEVCMLFLLMLPGLMNSGHTLLHAVQFESG